MLVRTHLSGLLWFFGAVGLLVRFTIKDYWLATAPLYYMLSFPIIACLFFAAAAISLKRRRIAQSIVAIAIGISCTVVWFINNYESNAKKQDASSAIKVMLWNAGRPNNLPNILAQFVSVEDPDIIALVEADDIHESDITSEALKDYQIGIIGGGLVMLVRGTIADQRLIRFGPRSKIGICVIGMDSQSFLVMLVDIDSNLLLSRKEVMQKIVEAKEQTNASIILGDFNTPPDSVWFRDLRKEYSQSFEAAGSGMHATWPSYVPLWAIDHIWVHRSINLLSSKIMTTYKSDHRYVVAEISFH